MTTSRNEALKTDHNVYILGAGFSVARGLPVIRDFLDRMRDSREHVASQPEADAIDAVLRFRADAAAASDRVAFDTENIEDLFSLAELSGDSEISAAIPLAIAATIDYAQSSSTPRKVRIETPPYFEHPVAWNGSAQLKAAGDRNHYHESLYEVLIAAFAGGLGRRGSGCRDTFITLNYDTALEEAATKLGFSADYGIDWPAVAGASKVADKPSVRILKLHGSVNWGQPKTPTDSCQVAKSYAALRAEGGRPLIVPPTWRKNFPKDLATVWSQAIEALSSATRVAVVGYSMPLSDSHFKYLLTAGLKANISLRRMAFVDRDPQFGLQGPPRPMTAVETRARALVRSDWWDRGRATFTGSGAEGFFLQTLRSPEWNRPWIDNSSPLNF